MRQCERLGPNLGLFLFISLNLDLYFPYSGDCERCYFCKVENPPGWIF